MADPLAQYLAEVSRHRRLARDQERALMTRARAGDAEARRALVDSLLKVTAEIATACDEPTGWPPLDKVQEANILLMRAVEDPSVTEIAVFLESAVPARLEEIGRRGPAGPREPPFGGE